MTHVEGVLFQYTTPVMSISLEYEHHTNIYLSLYVHFSVDNGFFSVVLRQHTSIGM